MNNKKKYQHYDKWPLYKCLRFSSPIRCKTRADPGPKDTGKIFTELTVQNMFFIIKAGIWHRDLLNLLGSIKRQIQKGSEKLMGIHRRLLSKCLKWWWKKKISENIVSMRVLGVDYSPYLMNQDSWWSHSRHSINLYHQYLKHPYNPEEISDCSRHLDIDWP